jgi:hypothetical protein
MMGINTGRDVLPMCLTTFLFLLLSFGTPKVYELSSLEEKFKPFLISG